MSAYGFNEDKSKAPVGVKSITFERTSSQHMIDFFQPVWKKIHELVDDGKVVLGALITSGTNHEKYYANVSVADSFVWMNYTSYWGESFGSFGYWFRMSGNKSTWTLSIADCQYMVFSIESSTGYLKPTVNYRRENDYVPFNSLTILYEDEIV